MIFFTCEQKKSYHSPTATKRFVKTMANHVRFQPEKSQPQIRHDLCQPVFFKRFLNDSSEISESSLKCFGFKVKIILTFFWF